jgi:tetratricopeptide (TPR) repeat protein
MAPVGPRAGRGDDTVLKASAAVTAVLLVAGAVVALLSIGTPHEPSVLDRYPELASADPDLCERVRAVLAELEARGIRSPSSGVTDLLRDLSRRGEAGTTALLRVLLELHGERGWMRTGTPFWNDRVQQPIGSWLADLGDAAPDEVLLRMAADREIAHELRVIALVGLCRAGHDAAVAPLVTIAADRSEDVSLRKDVLHRLPRIGRPLAVHLRDLLDIPFDEVDTCAAAALAAVGEMPAPSVLLAGLDSLGTKRGLMDAPSCLAQGIVVACAGDEHVRTCAEQVMGSAGLEEENRGKLAALGRVFAAWVERHPECRGTDFERRRSAYLASDRRRREMAIRTFDDILTAEDPDLAAAALACRRLSVLTRGRLLEKLDRLAGLLRRRIAGVDDPERIIEEMNHLLLPPPGRPRRWNWEGSPASDLSVVISHGAGNCLGLSLLYLSVARRLDLPIRCVRAPQHVFLRWDDGTTRRNIEPTEGGIERPDEWYAKRDDRLRIQPADIESGLFLSPLSEREILAMLLSNLSFSWARSRNLKETDRRYERAIECADRAIRLNPRCAEAYLNRADARLRRTPGAEEALADIETAVSVEPTSIPARLAAGRFQGNAKRYEEALRWFDSALVLAPDDAGIASERLKCLLGLGRLAQVVEDAGAVLEKSPDHLPIRIQRLRARVRLRGAAWRGDLDDIVRDHDVTVGLHLLVAELLLQPEAEAPAEPAVALGVLDEIRDLVEDAETDSKVSTVDGRLVVSPPDMSESQVLRYGQLREEALEALARDGD